MKIHNVLPKISVPSSLLSALKCPSMYYCPAVTLDVCAGVVGTPSTVLGRVAPIYRAALYVIAMYGMRSAEYLRAQVSDIISQDVLFIQGVKGSRSYTIQLPGLSAQFETEISKCPGRLVSGTTYLALYRASVKIGLGTLLANHRHATRTHIYRHKLANLVRDRGETAAGDLLRHRSRTSIKYYLTRRDV